ncbi:MAG: helix-turn-helix domain-containing protein [Acidothermaceae bacterium]
MVRVARQHLPAAGLAVEALGAMIAAGRRRRGWTATELAERLGTSAPTLRRIERGDPSVAIGICFDAAVLCGIDLFSSPPEQLDRVAREARLHKALLPARVRSSPVTLDDDF